MGILSYDGKKIIPASLVSLDKQTQTTADGLKIGTIYIITLKNRLLAYKGSPRSDGSFHTTSGYPADETISDNASLASLQRKIEALRDLFSVDGLELVVQSDSGATAFTCNPRVKSLNFPENQNAWFDVLDYSIVLEADTIFGETSLADERFTDQISSASENWALAENALPKSYNLTHTVSAVGKRYYTGTGILSLEAWQHAKNYVVPRLSYQGSYVTGSALASGIQNFAGLTQYNYQRSEDVGVRDGSYSVTENWVLATGTYLEDYSINIIRSSENNIATTQGKIDGNIRGLAPVMWDYDTMYANAAAGWAQIQALLTPRINTYSSGLNLINTSINYDRSRGTINYTCDLDNRPLTSGAYEEYTVSQKFQFNEYQTYVTIAGKIVGTVGATEDSPTLKYNRAYNRWLTVKGLLHDRVLTYATGIPNIKGTPTSKNVDVNPIEGSIAYSYEFTNRTPELANDEYAVSSSFNREQGFRVISINGTVLGYDQGQSGILLERYNNAVAAFPTDTDIYNRAVLYSTGLVFSNNPISKEVTRNINQGSISYNYVYSTQIGPCISGALSEVINVTDNNPSDVVAQIPVIGRPYGPVLQTMSTFTPRMRDINVELVMEHYVPGTGTCNYLTGYQRKPTSQVDTVINILKPTGVYVYKLQDTEQFSWINSRYSRSVTYIYEL